MQNVYQNSQDAVVSFCIAFCCVPFDRGFAEVYINSDKKKGCENEKLEKGSTGTWSFILYVLHFTSQCFMQTTISLVGVFGKILGKAFTYLLHPVALLGK